MDSQFALGIFLSLILWFWININEYGMCMSIRRVTYPFAISQHWILLVLLAGFVLVVNCQDGLDTWTCLANAMAKAMRCHAMPWECDSKVKKVVGKITINHNTSYYYKHYVRQRTQETSTRLNNSFFRHGKMGWCRWQWNNWCRRS